MQHHGQMTAIQVMFEDLTTPQLEKELARVSTLAIEATNSAAKVKTELMRRALQSHADKGE